MKGKQLRSMSLVPEMFAGNSEGSILSKKHHSRKAISLILTQLPSLNSRVGRRQSQKPRMEKFCKTLKITMIFAIPKEQPTHNGADHKCWPLCYYAIKGAEQSICIGSNQVGHTCFRPQFFKKFMPKQWPLNSTCVTLGICVTPKMGS